MIEIEFVDDEKAVEDIYWASWIGFSDAPDVHYTAISQQLYAQMLGWA